jgi:hypothetical protein
MVRWLYRYVFRGIGILLAIGMITILILAVSSQAHRSGTSPAAAPPGARP